MDQNPYESPRTSAYDARGAARVPGSFVLAAIGAWLASVYWAGLTLLLGLGVAAGSVSVLQVVLPVFLIGAYAFRGLQLYKGDVRAAQRILVLHVVGGVMAVIQIASGGSLTLVLYGIKIAIHVFGAATAYLARKAGTP